MNRRIIRTVYIIFLLGLFKILPIHGSNLYEETLNLGLPVLVVKTVDNEEPTCEYVDSPQGSMGSSITNATKVPGRLTIYKKDGSIGYDSGDYEKGESGITIKLRGNTSAYASQKPYKIKLQKKADLLMRGNKDFNDKNWVLLKDNQLKLFLGYEVSRLLEEEWTPMGMYVNLILNDDYRGMYYLVESIERNEKCRINVSENGFIMEHDPYWWNENGEYITSIDNPRFNYTYKYPDYEDIDEIRIQSITSALTKFEESINKNNYQEYIDMESFAKWILGHDILGTWDGGGANLYISKYDDSQNSLIKAGPLWDFDTIEIQENLWSGVHSSLTISKRFFSSEDTPFFNVYKKLWQEKGESVYYGLMDLLNGYSDNQKWDDYQNSSVATGKRWNTSTYSAPMAAKRDKEWLESRFEWLTTQLGEFEKRDRVEKFISSKEYPYRITSHSFVPLENNIEINVYSIDGNLIKSQKSVANEYLEFQYPGLYIIQYGNNTIKYYRK